MSSLFNLRVSAVAAVLGAAVGAQAYIISFAGTNTGGLIGLDWEYTNLVGLAPSFSVGVAGGETVGTASFVNGANFLNVEFANTIVVNGGTFSWSGTWAVTSSNGVNVNPTGTDSGSMDNLQTAGRYEWNFVGTQPVPEPAPFAALGLGAGVLALRRKRR